MDEQSSLDESAGPDHEIACFTLISFGSHERTWPWLFWIQAAIEASVNNELYNTSLTTIIIIINKITGDLKFCVCTNCRYLGHS